VFVVFVYQHVRRNYSLTAKDFEADRQQGLERARWLKLASSGKMSHLLVTIYNTAG